MGFSTNDFYVSVLIFALVERYPRVTFSEKKVCLGTRILLLLLFVIKIFPSKEDAHSQIHKLSTTVMTGIHTKIINTYFEWKKIFLSFFPKKMRIRTDAETIRNCRDMN